MADRLELPSESDFQAVRIETLLLFTIARPIDFRSNN